MKTLILACSATKRPSSAPVPAIELYDGPAFRTVRKNRRQDLAVLILSAEHGLIAEHERIATYDRKMDRARAAELADQVGRTLLELERAATLACNVLLYGGAAYRLAVRLGLERNRGEFLWRRMHRTRGAIGEQLGQLKAWLTAAPAARHWNADTMELA